MISPLIVVLNLFKKPLKAQKLFGLIIITLLIINSSQIYAHWLLNKAQLKFLRGKDTLEQYQQALELAPHDVTVRWQTGAALVRSGQISSARDVLLPLSHWDTNLNLMHLLMNVLLITEHKEEVVQVYQIAMPPLYLPVSIATRLLVLTQPGANHTVSNDHMKYLLADAFVLNTDTVAFQLFATKLAKSDFWVQPLGMKIKSALKWHQRSSSLLPSVCSQKKLNSIAIIAQLLGLPPNQIEIGNDIVNNGDFESYNSWEDTPNAWHKAFLTAGKPWNLALFIPGIETQSAFSGCRALRVDGLYIEHSPEQEPARAGFIHDPIDVLADQAYVISFVYRTSSDLQGFVSVWLSQDPQVLYADELALAPTNNLWKQATLIAWNRSGQNATIQPFLRSWSEGSVWFDSFSIHPLGLQPIVAPRDAIVDIRSAE